VTFLILVVLLYHEVMNYSSIEFTDHILVDTSLAQMLQISLNISLPHLRCDEVSVDTVDAIGEHQINVGGALNRLAIGPDLRVAAKPKASYGECWPCYEARGPPSGCCNSCAELRDAYKKADLDVALTKDKQACIDVQGCQISGAVKVGKVGGNVHIALGHSEVKDGKHVHEFNLRDVKEGFNTSHIIHKARFGSNVPGVTNPLDGTSRIVRSGAGMFHYYAKLVPMIYETQGKQIFTNLYSVTDSAKNVMVKAGVLTGLPGLFIVYEFNPFLVRRVEKVVPFSHFLTDICGIIGGVFTVAQLIDSAGHAGVSHMMKEKAKAAE